MSSISFSLADPVHAIGSIENLTLTGSGAINATGNALNNVLIGNSGQCSDRGAGADTLNGGGGVDTASYATSSAGVAVSLVTGIGSGGDAEGDRLSNIENLTGSNFDDTLEGNASNNILMEGQASTPSPMPMPRRGRMVRGSRSIYRLTSAQNTISAGTDTLSGFENLIGSQFNDTLTGTSGNNIFSAGSVAMTG